MKCDARDILLQCTICGQDKHASSFPQHFRKIGMAIRRCIDCNQKCSECNQKMTCGKQFATNSSTCWRCHAGVKQHTCDACLENLPAVDFSQGILDHAKKHSRKKVCKKCEALGCSPKDVQTYQCAGCQQFLGHVGFDKQLLADWKRGHTSTLACTACLTSNLMKMHECNSCKDKKTRRI